MLKDNIKTIIIGNDSFLTIVDSPSEEIFWEKYCTGNWESTLLNFLVQHANGGVFLDIGSWIGPISLLMAKHYEKVIAIDLDPVANEKFKANCSINNIDNIVLNEIGFADRESVVFVDGSKLGSSETSIFQVDNNKAIPARVTRFDDFVNQLTEAENISFIKVDCEGAEYLFLTQIYKFIRKRRVKVSISYHPFVLSKYKYYFLKIVHWIIQLRYKRYYFTKEGQVITKKPYVPCWKNIDRLPLADIIESI